MLQPIKPAPRFCLQVFGKVAWLLNGEIEKKHRTQVASVTHTYTSANTLSVFGTVYCFHIQILESFPGQAPVFKKEIRDAVLRGHRVSEEWNELFLI